MKPIAGILMMVLPLTLGGCMGAGMLAKGGARHLFGKKEKPASERIEAAQETAITTAHGGSPGLPIAWSDATAGIDGSLLFDPDGNAAPGCHAYKQTVIFVGETLQGRVIACARPDGSWKLLSGTASSRT